MLQRVVDEAVAGERIVDKGIVGVERFPFGVDVGSIDANDGVQCSAGNFVISLLRITPSKRHGMPNRSFGAIGPSIVDLKKCGTGQIVRGVQC
ncbi:hypothetical protein D9M71_767950 [compost metagenome]